MIKNLYKPIGKGDHKIWRQYHIILDFIKYNTDSLVILDRFFPSQAVYSILRGEDDSILPIVKKLEAELKWHGCFYIYLTCSWAEIEKRYNKRGDEHVTLEQLKIICRRYNDYYDKCSLLKIKLDTKDKNWLKKLINLVGKI